MQRVWRPSLFRARQASSTADHRRLMPVLPQRLNSRRLGGDRLLQLHAGRWCPCACRTRASQPGTRQPSRRPACVPTCPSARPCGFGNSCSSGMQSQGRGCHLRCRYRIFCSATWHGLASIRSARQRSPAERVTGAGRRSTACLANKGGLQRQLACRRRGRSWTAAQPSPAARRRSRQM